jgi:hypothetical protein
MAEMAETSTGSEMCTTWLRWLRRAQVHNLAEMSTGSEMAGNLAGNLATWLATWLCLARNLPRNLARVPLAHSQRSPLYQRIML